MQPTVTAERFIEADAAHLNGWFYKPDMVCFYVLNHLQKALKVGGDLCEVGVFEGKSLVLLSLLKGAHERLMGFDIFDGDLKEKSLENLARYGAIDNVTLHKVDTTELTTSSLRGVIERSLRFLHIDAGHEYHEVLQQLEMFSQFVGNCGIIAMDDYQDREFPGIEAATLDFAQRSSPRRFVPFFSGLNKMFLCESHLAPIYQANLLAHPNFLDRCRLSRVRDFTVLVGYSKLAVPSVRCLDLISAQGFPFLHSESLEFSAEAVLYQQRRFGSGTV